MEVVVAKKSEKGHLRTVICNRNLVYSYSFLLDTISIQKINLGLNRTILFYSIAAFVAFTCAFRSHDSLGALFLSGRGWRAM
jgi:hypothetical protein